MVVWPDDMQHTFPKKETVDGKPAKYTWAWLQDMAATAGCRIDCRGRTGSYTRRGAERRRRPTRLTIRGPPSIGQSVLQYAIAAAESGGRDMMSVIKQVPRTFDSWGPAEDRKRAELAQVQAEQEAEDAGPPEDSEGSDTAASSEYDDTVPDYGDREDRGRKRRHDEVAAEPPSDSKRGSRAGTSGGGGAPRGGDVEAATKLPRLVAPPPQLEAVPRCSVRRRRGMRRLTSPSTGRMLSWWRSP